MLRTLTEVDWLKLQEIVDKVTALPSDERGRYVEDACVEWPTLRPQVDALLAALEGTSFNSELIARSLAESAVAEHPTPGTRVGPYRILEMIGQGGMGAVYRAVRDDDEYRKEVAIKVVSGGLYLPALRQRFLRERQILANLEHPNIARLLDGGTTQEGLPYVVMEYVSGKPIDRYCREAKDGGEIGQRDKIELMVQVARAVDYAHRHLVVHRDLKPDNIYVTAEGVPKLLDFGIAKALAPEEAGIDSARTIDAARLMTPAYASPEQVRGEVVTTATDVYQIGMVLYLLLTGKTPFQADAKMRMGVLEQMICETPPARPGCDRDLDQIVLHALEKDPTRRYASAGAMADDLERYLHGFPVEARPASVFYRAAKFVRRNKLAVGAAAVLVLVLVGFMSALTVEVGRVKQQRDLATQQRDSANQIANFLVNIFSAPDPTHARGRNLSARDLLDRGAQTIQAQNTIDPEVKDRLLTTLAKSYDSLGEFDRALGLYRQLLQLRQRRYGELSKEYVEALGNVAYADLEAENYDDMMQVLPRWVALTREVNGDYSQEAENALGVMALDSALQGDFQRAESSEQQVLAITRKLNGDSSPQTLRVYSSLGLIQEYRGEDDRAEASYRAVLNALEKGDWQNSEYVIWILDTRGKLGCVLTEEGRYPEAEVFLRDVVERERKILGTHNSQVGDAEINAGFLDASTARYEQAEKLFKDAIAIHSEVLGPHSLWVGGDEDQLARLYIFEGKYDLAEPLLEKSIANLSSMTRAAGAQHLGEHPVVARALRHLGIVQMHEHKYAEAEESLHRALEGESTYNSPTSPYAGQDYQTLGEILEAEGKQADAEANMRKALNIYLTTAQLFLHNRAVTQENLGELLLKEHRNAEARTMLNEAVAILQKELPPTAPALRHAEWDQEKAEPSKIAYMSPEGRSQGLKR